MKIKKERKIWRRRKQNNLRKLEKRKKNKEKRKISKM
jgi:hypothetical protein